MSDLTVIELNETQRMMLEQKTAPQLIRFRAGRGGKQYPFVDIAEVIRALNDAFNWDWDFETDQEEILHVQGKPFEVKVRGRLTVRVSGRQLVKMQYGAQAIEFKKDSDEPVSLADCYKGAASDALKKCASELGLFLDLYDSDANITPQSVENAKRAQLQSAAPNPERAPLPEMNLKPGGISVPSKQNSNGKTAQVKTAKWGAVIKRAVSAGYVTDDTAAPHRLLHVVASAGVYEITDDNLKDVWEIIKDHYAASAHVAAMETETAR